jgi:hypothetical protein
VHALYGNIGGQNLLSETCDNGGIISNADLQASVCRRKDAREQLNNLALI